jgi:oxygen-dependent protoporphyrinogen oxidase
MRSHSHVSCIPTLSVGHLERMDGLRAVLKALPWNGRLEVIGAGVGGVSVGDCVEAGKRVGCMWT